ncbi:zinc finger protein 574 isoform X2 [Denticeps clupeoides]|nr:zinc finger protein 569-like isoform X2 [Denticeps clupeoides]
MPQITQVEYQTSVGVPTSPEPSVPDKRSSSADVPRILYQCGDCEVLFDSLILWQQHRKQGNCQDTGQDQEGPDYGEADGAEVDLVTRVDERENVITHYELEESVDGMKDGQTIVYESQAEINSGSEVQPDLAAEPSQEAVASGTDGPETQEAPPHPETAPVEEDYEEEQEPPVRKRGPKKAKPPSSLLCVDCGMGFGAVAELVSHRRSQHGLADALHRCHVCGESFLNTTLFLYHRKQHRQRQQEMEQVEEAQIETVVESPIPIEVSEVAHGQGLLLLAAAGEGQSLGIPTVLTNEMLQGALVEGVTSQEVEFISEQEENGAEQPEIEAALEAGDENLPKDTEEEKGATEEKEQMDVEEVFTSAPASTLSPTPQQEKSFLCNHCGICFTSEPELLEHRRTQHGLKGALHCCPVCGLEFMNTTQFLYHRREHKNTDAGQGGSAMGAKRILSPPSAASGLSRAKVVRMGMSLLKSSQQENSATVLASEDTEPAKTTIFLQSVTSPQHLQNLSTTPVTLSEAAIPPPPAKLTKDWSRTSLPHVCPHCGRTFTRRCLLRAHVYSHTGEKLFSCKVCGKAFASPNNLLRHSQTHAPIKPFRCGLCGKTFSQAGTLKRHSLTHSRPGARRRVGRVRPGKMSSEDQGPFLHCCPECPASFRMNTQLQKHRLLHTSHPFTCEYCGDAFTRRKDLDLHSLQHQDKEPKSCPQCSAQFLNQAVLDIHLQRCTAQVSELSDCSGSGRGRGQGRGRSMGQLECDMCGHRCVTQEGLELHRLSHTGQTPLRCPLAPCRRRFATSAALGDHVLAHCQGMQGKSQTTPRRFRCQHCGKEFAYASTFAVHMRIHTDERPFECSHCGKRFRQLPHLQDHERIHSGLRPFVCWVCGKSFSVAARLTEHARVHSGEKPYACPRCPATFRSRPNLDKHLRLHADDPIDPAAEAVMGEGESAVQTILLVQAPASPTSVSSVGGAEVEEGAVILPADQVSAAGAILPGSGSSVVILHPSITVPNMSMSSMPISVVESHDVPHTLEFIIEETV